MLYAITFIAVICGWVCDRYFLTKQIRLLEKIAEQTQLTNENQQFIDEQLEMAHPLLLRNVPDTAPDLSDSSGGLDAD